MHADDFIVNETYARKLLEDIAELTPNTDVVSSLAFVKETVDTVNRLALVISSKQEKVIRIFNLVGE